jgi:hypothetical protein
MLVMCLFHFQSSVLDEPIDEASCIVADLDNRLVECLTFTSIGNEQ